MVNGGASFFSRSAIAIFCVVCLALFLVGCGGSNSTPTTPTVRLMAVSGSVTDSAGAGFQGAQVSLFGSKAVTPTITLADGAFTMRAEMGSYVLTVSYKGANLLTQNVVVGEQDVSLGKLKLPKPTITGIVKDDRNTPLAGAQIMLAQITLTITGTDGSFTLQMDPGNYALSVCVSERILKQWQQSVNQEPSQTLGTVTIPLAMLQLPVRGMVVDSIGGPFVGATVTMTGTKAVDAVTTSSDGSFELQAESGTYNLTVSHSGESVITQAVTVANAAVELGSLQLPRPTITGVVLDAKNKPVVGAQVVVNGTSQATVRALSLPRKAIVKAATASGVTTAADGSFTLQLDPGEYGISILYSEIVLLDSRLTVGQHPIQALAPVVINTDLAADTDQDGLADFVETSGWDILLDELGNGEYTKRHVTGDPANADTDGDGLTDKLEYAYRTDPRRPDTDGDGINDVAELDVYFSNPNSVDSDGDARGPAATAMPNPKLFDGAEANRPCGTPVGEGEVNVCATSPILADTDGDGLTDYEEILGGGFNPLRADLPNIQIDVAGDPVAALNIEFEGTTESKSVQSVLSKESTQTVVTDTISDKYSLETTTKAEAGVSGLSVNASSSWEFKAAMALEASFSTSATSARESQKNLEETIGKNEVQRYRDGTLSVPMRIRNLSNLSIKVANVNVIASRVRPSTYGATALVGTLEPKSFPTSGWVLSPGSDLLFEATNAALNGTLMQPVIANPGAMQFQLGVLSIHQVDAAGNAVRDFNAVSQSVLERCGLVVIDYGNGTVQRHAVATNVYRNPDGSSAGANLKQVLEKVLGLQVELASDPRFVRTLGPVSGNPNARQYWVIVGEGSDFASDSTTRFDQLRLQHGQRITLMFQGDADGDGLPDREERLLGTGPIGDTDGDGISDWDEVKAGWDVKFKDTDGNVIAGLTRHVFSDPRMADADGDGLTDLQERSSSNRDATDPNLADTDHDGTIDSLDTVADAQEISGPPKIGLIRYYHLDKADAYSGGSGWFLRDYSGTGSGKDPMFMYDGTGRWCKTWPYPNDGADVNPGGWAEDEAGMYSFPNRQNVPGTATYFWFNYGHTQDQFGVAEMPCAMAWWGSQIRESEARLGGSITASIWVYLDPVRVLNLPWNSPLANVQDVAWDPATDAGWQGYALDVGRFAFFVKDGKMMFRYKTGYGSSDAIEITDPNRLERRRWHHFTGVFDSTTSAAKLYKDGVVVARGAGSLDLAGLDIGDFWIGGTWGSLSDHPLAGVPSRPWKGALDEVRIYNRALSDDEVVRLSQDTGAVPTED